jgi:hypothetical protein
VAPESGRRADEGGVAGRPGEVVMEGRLPAALGARPVQPQVAALLLMQIRLGQAVVGVVLGGRGVGVADRRADLRDVVAVPWGRELGVCGNVLICYNGDYL